jgi:hypothetical protein
MLLPWVARGSRPALHRRRKGIHAPEDHVTADTTLTTQSFQT